MDLSVTIAGVKFPTCFMNASGALCVTREELITLGRSRAGAIVTKSMTLDPQVLVAVQGGDEVGFVAFDRSRDPKTPATMGEIWSFYVMPSHWGQGVGLALWDAARDALLEEGCTHVTAWVPLGYERALRFFDLAGFKREMTSIKTVQMGSTRVEEIRFKRELK